MSSLPLLPLEIIQNIANNLNKQDFCTFRLTNRIISIRIQALLATKTFLGLPWRDDTTRLDSLSKLIPCASRIQSIHFNMAQLDEWHLKTSYQSHWTPEREAHFKFPATTWASYVETKRMAENAGPLLPAVVATALMRLPALEALTLTWTRCPWEDEELKRMFREDRSIRLAKTKLFEMQKLVFEALLKANVHLQKLEVEPILLHKLSLPMDRIDPHTGVFNSLQTLRLLLFSGRPSHETDTLTALGLMLSRMPLLKHLSLEFLYWLQGDGWSDFLPDTYLPHLESLELVRPVIRLADLGGFLSRHAGTLESLRICHGTGVDPSQGNFPDDEEGEEELPPLIQEEEESVSTWEDVFRLIHDQLSVLKYVAVQGRIEDRNGVLIFLLGDEKLDRDSELLMDGALAMSAAPLQSYLLRRGEFPDLAWDTLGL